MERADDLVYLSLHSFPEQGVVCGKPGLRCGLALHAADPAVEDQRQCAAVRTGFGRHIPDQFLIGRQSLSLCSLEPPLRGKVSIHYHEVPVHHIAADGLEQKAFAAAVFAHDKPERCAAVCDNFHVVEQGVDLLFSAYGKIGQSDAGNYAAFQRIDDRRCDSFWYFHSDRSFLCGFRQTFPAMLQRLRRNPRSVPACHRQRELPYRRNHRTKSR